MSDAGERSRSAVIRAARKLIKELQPERGAITEYDHAPWVGAFDKLEDALQALDATTSKGK